MVGLISYFLFAVVVSFICSVLEAVLLSITPPFMESYAKNHPKSGKILRHLKANIDNAIGAILVVNTFANTVGASGVGAQAIEIFGEAWQGFVALFMTLSILYISEILPKTIGATYWKSLVLPASYLIYALYFITFPFVYVSRIITHMFRKGSSDNMSRDEILAVVELGEKSGSINELESDILEHIIAQQSLSIADIMTPKEQMLALKDTMSIHEALLVSDTHKYSRIPLLDSEGNAPMLVYRQHLLQANLEKRGEESVKNIATDFERVDDSMHLLDLLENFILQKEHLFCVVNSKKKLIGVVALEDVMNAVIGVGNLQRH